MSSRHATQSSILEATCAQRGICRKALKLKLQGPLSPLPPRPWESLGMDSHGHVLSEICKSKIFDCNLLGLLSSPSPPPTLASGPHFPSCRVALEGLWARLGSGGGKLRWGFVQFSRGDFCGLWSFLGLTWCREADTSILVLRCGAGGSTHLCRRLSGVWRKLGSKWSHSSIRSQKLVSGKFFQSSDA